MPLKNRTSELLSETINIDPVTGYPVETSQARGKVLNILQEAISTSKLIVFIDSDIDNLKTLNDAVGKKMANYGIRAVIEEKEKNLLTIKKIEIILVYRPQAGGDEFKVLLLLSGIDIDKEEITTEIWDLLKPDTLIKPENKSVVAIGCSYGIVIIKPTGNENPGELLQKMENQAEEKLVEEKMNKITQKLNETIESGSSLNTRAYIDLIVSEWGSIRLGGDVLKEILISVSKKTGIK